MMPTSLVPPGPSPPRSHRRRPSATPAFSPSLPVLSAVPRSQLSSCFLCPLRSCHPPRHTPLRRRSPSRTPPHLCSAAAAASSSSSSSSNGTSSSSTPTPTPTPTSTRPSSPATRSPDAVADDSLPYRLTAAARARTLVSICKSGTLCTSSVRHRAVPFGSHVDFVQDVSGNPVFLLAANANHTRNLASDPNCSLFCQPSTSAGQDGNRATLVGTVSPLKGSADEADLRDLYLDTHAHATEALRYEELFKFYRMTVSDLLFVSGYGVTSQWVDCGEFARAQPDSLAFDAPGIVNGINGQKESDLKRLCRVFLDVDHVASCKMTNLDCLGFDLRVRSESKQTFEFRVAFREGVQNRFDVQSALVKTFQEAWERENGFDETWEGEDARPTVLYIRTY